MPRLTPVGVCLLAAIGCDPGGIGGRPTLSDGDRLELQLVQAIDWSRTPDDPVAITSASVDGLLLHATLQFGGGCATHRFALVAGSPIAESNPPYTRFHLAHDAQGDACDALLTKHAQIDLSPIVPLALRSGRSLRFELFEPRDQRSAVGELRIDF